MVSYASQFLTTSSVDRSEATDYWVDLICDTFVKLSAQQVDHDNFRGHIHWQALGDLEFSTVTASGQDVVRTRKFASSASDEFLLFSIQRRGEGKVSQDGKSVTLKPDQMAVYDSGRPYTLHFPGPFQQLVVQVPKSSIGLNETREITAMPYGAGTPGSVIAPLLISMNHQLSHGGDSLAPLKDHVLGVLSQVAGRPRESLEDQLPEDLIRSRVIELMRDDIPSPQWTVERLAKRCHLSVRTLYRLFPNEGIASVMRALRIEEAKRLLRQNSGLTLIAIAHRCGFESESGFIRAFRAKTGTTPSAYATTRFNFR